MRMFVRIEMARFDSCRADLVDLRADFALYLARANLSKSHFRCETK